MKNTDTVREKIMKQLEGYNKLLGVVQWGLSKNLRLEEERMERTRQIIFQIKAYKAGLEVALNKAYVDSIFREMWEDWTD